MRRDVLLRPLARNWSGLMFRALLAIAFGVATFAWPTITLEHLVYLFGLYALFDGIATLAIAMDVLTLRSFWIVLTEALVRLVGGLAAMGAPEVIYGFPRFLAIWALMAGGADALVAVKLRREMSGEWPLPLAAAISASVAVWLLVRPPDAHVAAAALRWPLGLYAILAGVSLLAFARRLRQLADEMAETTAS